VGRKKLDARKRSDLKKETDALFGPNDKEMKMKMS